MNITIYDNGLAVWAEQDEGPDAETRHIGDFSDTNSAWHYCRGEYPTADITVERSGS